MAAVENLQSDDLDDSRSNSYFLVRPRMERRRSDFGSMTDVRMRRSGDDLTMTDIRMRKGGLSRVEEIQ